MSGFDLSFELTQAGERISVCREFRKEAMRRCHPGEKLFAEFMLAKRREHFRKLKVKLDQQGSSPAPEKISPDANVERVRRQLLERSVVGLNKYGVTTERGDLSLMQWLRHAQEEALDLAVYLERLIQDEMKKQNSENN